jgi:hypothetical protein
LVLLPIEISPTPGIAGIPAALWTRESPTVIITVHKPIPVTGKEDRVFEEENVRTKYTVFYRQSFNGGFETK